MKIGDEVDIFQKPATKEDFEGKAKIVKINSVDNMGFTRATVEFIGEPGDHYFRAIL